jgi:MFS family permease
MAAMYCFSMFYRVSTALIAVDLTREFGVSPGQLSVLGAAFFYTFAFAQLPLGPALDRLGAKRIILVASVVAGWTVWAGAAANTGGGSETSSSTNRRCTPKNPNASQASPANKARPPGMLYLGLRTIHFMTAANLRWGWIVRPGHTI